MDQFSYSVVRRFVSANQSNRNHTFFTLCFHLLRYFNRSDAITTQTKVIRIKIYKIQENRSSNSLIECNKELELVFMFILSTWSNLIKIKVIQLLIILYVWPFYHWYYYVFCLNHTIIRRVLTASSCYLR